MSHHRPLSSAAAFAASLLFLTLASAPRAQATDVARATAARDLPALKAAYLRCEAAAAERLLGSGDAASCSLVYEELLERGFGGDFRRLLAWWHAERVAKAGGERIATP